MNLLHIFVEPVVTLRKHFSWFWHWWPFQLEQIDSVFFKQTLFNVSKEYFKKYFVCTYVRGGHHQSVSHIELVNDWATLWQGTRNDGVCDKKMDPPTHGSSLKNTPLQFCRKQIAANMRRLVWSLCDLQSQWRRQEEEEGGSRSQKCSLLQKKVFYNRNQPDHRSHHQHRHYWLDDLHYCMVMIIRWPLSLCPPLSLPWSIITKMIIIVPMVLTLMIKS